MHAWMGWMGTKQSLAGQRRERERDERERSKGGKARRERASELGGPALESLIGTIMFRS